MEGEIRSPVDNFLPEHKEDSITAQGCDDYDTTILSLL
jgi:hypothetical protein